MNQARPHPRALLFTGHMVDLPTRAQPRFPPSLEDAAAKAIAAAMNRRLERLDPAKVAAVSSLARGGDILFQEHARERNLAAHVVLPFEPHVFVAESVRGVDSGHWEERFWRTWNAIAPERREVLAVAPGDDPYEACNKRLLAVARQLSGEITLVALSDGTADGAGGTQDLIGRTREAGGDVDVIDVKQLRARGRTDD